MSSGWRDLGELERKEFLEWILEAEKLRQEVGIAKYGYNFVGDPLDQLIEELFDALFYAWVELRKRAL